MSGANSLTSLGTGFIVLDKHEPNFTVESRGGGNFKVCVRRTYGWKEIIAEFKVESHAKFYVEALLSGRLKISDYYGPVKLKL